MEGNVDVELEQLKRDFELLKLNFARRIANLEEKRRGGKHRNKNQGAQRNTKPTVAAGASARKRHPRNPFFYRAKHPIVLDRDDRVIHIGDQVQFLTQGKYRSTEGKVYKISECGDRVTSRDSDGNPISRDPNNLLVLSSEYCRQIDI